MVPEFLPPPTLAERARAYSVHLLTASGIVFVFLAASELTLLQPNVSLIFFWLTVAVIVDAIDGPLARRWRVGQLATRLDGRTLDDIIDYLSFTFIPLMLVWKMEWAGPYSAPLVIMAMMASLLGFANIYAKQDAAGFFSGFPSYWNLAAWYAGLWFWSYGEGPVIVLMIVLIALTLLPVRFIYPNRARQPWRLPVLVGACLWLLLLLASLPFYPDLPEWYMWASLSYPAFYLALSIYLDIQDRLVAKG